MNIAKYIDFDLYLNRIKVRNQKQAFQLMATEAAPMCGVPEDDLFEVFQDRYEQSGVSGENGVIILDVQSDDIKEPVMWAATIDKGVDFNMHDTKPADILVGIVSPKSYGTAHLRNLSSIARLFRAKNLCDALRETKNEDEMRMLFMPSQDWMIAA